ncbi:MAG: TAXI family TRAP transporter solute-binding subunit [Gammaproteobacteria bacterium]|nr:TAXI family TRAP transporter solute-binding subunit [Gammaproteobacteria bacterium]
MSRLFHFLITLAFSLSACSDQLRDNRTYVLSTGTTGGTFYPVGVALSTLVSAEEADDFSLTAISSAGSMENLKLLRDNQAQFALILGIFAAWAYDGSGPVSRPQENLRSISAMWPNVEHFVLRSDLVTSGTIGDLNNLKGERYSIGMRNSGAEYTGFYIFEALGIDWAEDLSVAYIGYGPSANALQDGNIAGMNVPAGPPVTAITRAYALLGDSMTVLNFSKEEIALINSEFPLWESYELAPETYPNQQQSINTAASPNVLVVRADVSEEIVYEMTRMLWENLATLQEIHSATKSMALENALSGVPLPLHAGALRYYEEQGVSIPDHLRDDIEI